MRLALIACCAAATLAAGCASPSVNAIKVTDRAERDGITTQGRIDAYYRADNGDPGRSGDRSRNPADSGN